MHRSLQFVTSDPIEGLIRVLDPARRMGFTLQRMSLRTRPDSALVAMDLNVSSDEAFSSLLLRVETMVGISDIRRIPPCELRT